MRISGVRTPKFQTQLAELPPNGRTEEATQAHVLPQLSRKIILHGSDEYGSSFISKFSKMKKRGTIAALAILMGGAITVSCKKEQCAKYRKAKITTIQAKDGGDDDEDPVIRGKVKKHSLSPVDSAYVETITYGSNVSIGAEYTDNLGRFDQKADSGIYYFRVTVPGISTPYVTDTVHVNKDIEVTIFVD